MEAKLLSDKVKEIKMPEEMEKRIVERCKESTVLDMKKERESRNMSKNIGNRKWHKSFVMAASLVVCICVTGITAMAASGQMKGFFKDKLGWNGAVVGTTYEQATDEIFVSVVKTDVEEELEILVTFVNSQKAPYSEMEEVRVENYQILDVEGKIVVEGTMEDYQMMEETVNMRMPLDTIEEGSYKLVITAFSGAKKADQPLSIYGEWECEFTK